MYCKVFEEARIKAIWDVDFFLLIVYYHLYKFLLFHRMIFVLHGSWFVGRNGHGHSHGHNQCHSHGHSHSEPYTYMNVENERSLMTVEVTGKGSNENCTVFANGRRLSQNDR